MAIIPGKMRKVANLFLLFGLALAQDYADYTDYADSYNQDNLYHDYAKKQQVKAEGG